MCDMGKVLLSRSELLSLCQTQDSGFVRIIVSHQCLAQAVFIIVFLLCSCCKCYGTGAHLLVVVILMQLWSARTSREGKKTFQKLEIWSLISTQQTV